MLNHKQFLFSKFTEGQLVNDKIKTNSEINRVA